MGITGTWEGWVPTTTDLYLRGDNIASFVGSNVTFESGGILHGNDTSVANITSGRSYNISPYQNINFQICLYEASYLNGSTYSGMDIKVGRDSNNIWSNTVKRDIMTGQTFIISVNLNTVSLTSQIYIGFTHYRVMPNGSTSMRGCKFWVYHIWLS